MTAGARSMKLRKSTTHYFLAILVCIAAMVVAGRPQKKPPTPTPEPAPAPTGELPGKSKIKDKEPKTPKMYGLPPQIEFGEGVTSERSIMVDPKVTLDLCVTQGTISVNGWSRNEVRVFIKDGSRFDFKIREKSREGAPALMSLIGIRKLPSGATAPSACIVGDEIELDVPENTSFTLKGHETTTAVDTLRNVDITTAGGDVSVRNVSHGVRAKTFEGDLVVENSEGQISLETTSGNVIVSGAASVEVSDSFWAKTTSGMISLQKLGFRRAEVNSVSGSVAFIGELLSGGSFSFTTTNGAVRLTIPSSTSCRINATYAFGNFKSDLPIKIETENIQPGSVKTIVGKIGDGDCTLRVTTSNGAIAIKKEP
jgi:hypothetical protein